MANDILNLAYRSCLQVTQRHYENFPTASRLLAKPQRYATAAIYAFARTADDIADEGDIADHERYTRLDDMENQLRRLADGITPEDPLFLALSDTIQKFQLPIQPFEKLLSAFRSDIDIRRYPSFNVLAAYCENSANPIGELMLRLHGEWTEGKSLYSDKICTALQLTNFIQDLEADYQQRGRLYIPQDEMLRYGITEEQIAEQRGSDMFDQLIQHQLLRANSFLLAGMPLIMQCRGRLQFLLKLIVTSTQQLIRKLQTRASVFDKPTLTSRDMLPILIHSLLFRTS